ncbi:hypothetical protein HQ45_09035 [Porphyromonas crevioricanis]|uniref:Lipoprotein, putative n=1 Tax=Porphyromonas crevioricanis JCM 15906 TaxID=1305617 RepID=T1DT19_9PORP|nr:hypothetical protein [Porphyromonas crevioricanis]KGN88818.1 hypothetical protein HQ45_09035 [Porphyromonas crevioricanis]GAD05554.1 lipoprotein, putative [Porphyromonas crevioricanis JCM 15906]SJZ71561.1 hypothetical protein SAMN02745203_00634 [Porphyromonas crevioricanis]
MNKKVIFGLALVAAFTSSCGRNSSAYKELKAQYDSVFAINAAHEAELGEMDSLISTVLTNFQEISQMEGMINVNPISGDFKKSQRDRIRDNMQLINEKLQSNRENIQKLSQQIEKFGRENKGLQRTLASLRKQFADKTAEIQHLNDELVRKNLYIGMQDSIIGLQNAHLNDMAVENASQRTELMAQERELNTVRYAIGTARDLKDMGLLKDGKVVTDKANMGYFSSADLRELNQIALQAKKAELLTSHPASSYELRAGNKGELSIIIKDAKQFWSVSKILIVKVK